MHVNIQGRHLPITPALHSYIKEKLQKVKYYFDHIIHVHVVLSVEGSQQLAEVTITAEHHHFHNKIASDDMYKSIDQLFDKIERQIRRYKEVVQSKSGSRRARHDQEIRSAGSQKQHPIEEVEIAPKPMSDLEAVLQLSEDGRGRYLGYSPSEDAVHPSFVCKEDPSSYSLYYWDNHWELKQVRLTDDKQLEISTVESIRLSSESIPDAIDYLDHNQAVSHRLIWSPGADTVILVYRSAKGSYGLIREALNA